MLGTYCAITKAEAKELGASARATAIAIEAAAEKAYRNDEISVAERDAKMAFAADYYAKRLDYITERLAA